MAVVLHLEDEEHNQNLVRTLLESAGQTVITAGTVEEARRILASRQVDALIADNTLPDGKGLDLIEELANSGVQIPTIFVSSEVVKLQYDPQFMRLREKVAIDETVMKPFTPETLAKALAHINIHAHLLKQNAPVASIASADTPPPLLGRHILVVDSDEESLRQNLQEELTVKGAAVDIAASVEEAKAKLAATARPYDAVVLRLETDGAADPLGGTQLVRHMQETGDKTPVIVHSSQHSNASMMEYDVPESHAILSYVKEAGMPIEHVTDIPALIAGKLANVPPRTTTEAGSRLTIHDDAREVLP